ncbi:MAG: hypothetical protein WCE21_05045 [Candidatus Babeliales bacterium]
MKLINNLNLLTLICVSLGTTVYPVQLRTGKEVPAESVQKVTDAIDQLNKTNPPLTGMFGGVSPAILVGQALVYLATHCKDSGCNDLSLEQFKQGLKAEWSAVFRFKDIDQKEIASLYNQLIATHLIQDNKVSTADAQVIEASIRTPLDQHICPGGVAYCSPIRKKKFLGEMTRIT